MFAILTTTVVRHIAIKRIVLNLWVSCVFFYEFGLDIVGIRDIDPLYLGTTHQPHLTETVSVNMLGTHTQSHF